MPFKGISYLELWQPFCPTECKHLSNFVEGIIWISGGPPLH